MKGSCCSMDRSREPMYLSKESISRFCVPGMPLPAYDTLKELCAEVPTTLKSLSMASRSRSRMCSLAVSMRGMLASSSMIEIRSCSQES